MTGHEPTSSRAAGLAGVVVAALLLLVSLGLYLMSGEAVAEGDGGPSSKPPGPPTSVYQSFPGCRVDVDSNGVGAARRHHVAVTLDNDVRELWLVVTTADGAERTFHVPAAQGWGHVSLDGSLRLTSIAVNGSANLEDFMTGCTWTAPTART